MVGRYGNGGRKPEQCLPRGLLALKDLPPRERAYWRAMFDTHVFGDPELSAVHIPEALRGALGAMRPEARAALRRQLTAAFRT